MSHTFHESSNGTGNASCRGSARIPIWIVATILVLPINAPMYGQSQARNVVYAEVSTILLHSGASINYERFLHDHFSIRAGLGQAWIFNLPFAFGPQLMVNFFTKKTHKFELGAGANVLASYFGGEPQWWPAFSVGYRLQQQRAGFFLRAGLAWTYGYGLPFQISMGHSF